ncbi:MAG: hypothetical protein KF900_07345 [Bacteroidetes bacterium]|nr:hypothetical protein [Bacteroidota bacterium]
MKKNSFIFLGLLFPLFSFSQETQTFYFKKENPFLFFQKGAKSDSIIKNQNDVFYLIVPDSLKKSISILVENGQIHATNNDSLVKLNYLFGLKYESLFQKNAATDKPELKTFINGGTNYLKQTITLEITDTKTGTLLLKNSFFYSE